MAIPWAKRLLEHFGDEPNVRRNDFYHATYTVGCPPVCRRHAWKMAWRSYRFRRLEVRRPLYATASYVSPPAAGSHRPFRSKYEERVAGAFVRLGVRFEYEAHSFEYQDAKGTLRTYTPDFGLSDLHMTYVEVKGPQGAAPADRVKHHLVLRRHAITLLLWDATVVDMVESMEHPSELMGLLGTTRLTV
jgi:hypothetical protein